MSGSEREKSFGFAKLNWTGPDFWCVYADGYKRAAELLIECEKGIYETNTVIFPILALYRQYLELALKEIIAYGQFINGAGRMPKHHELDKLWASAKNYILEHLALEKNEIDRLQSFVEEVHYYDPTSQGARYPVVKPKGEAKTAVSGSFSHTATYLSLDQLHDHIGEAGRLLSGITYAMSILQDQAAEARSIEQSF